MDLLKCVIFIISFSVFSQGSGEALFIKKTNLKDLTIAAIDNFESLYLVDHAVLSKITSGKKIITYSNVQLGDITSVNAFNPLKIFVFYKDFNTAIILDNRLAEIFKIDFNTKQPYRNASFMSMGHDSTLWLFNQDTQQLELYDYKLNSTRLATLPIAGRIIDMKSNYNYCYLLSENQLLIYNYFGSLIAKIKNDGFTSISENNENILLKKGNALFLLKKNSATPIPIKLPNLSINAFFVTNQTLYIYDSKTLHQFQIKIN